MKRIVYGTVLVAAVHLLAANALTCPDGIVCIQDNDGTELCAEHAYGGINCPAGSKPKVVGVRVPICDSGNVPCIQNNDGTGFCYPGYICPAGSTQLGPVTLPDCPNNQQMCVYGAMYGCFDWECPSGMTPVGTIDCTIPPKTCASGEKLCLYDIGNAFACQSAGYDCWPGTHQWKSCGPSLDFPNNRIKLEKGHYIKCMNGLKKQADNSVYCAMPLFDSVSWPLHYSEGKLLYIRICVNSDNSLRWLLPLAQSLGFSRVGGQWNGAEQAQLTLPQTWLNEFWPAGPPYAEYCYVDGAVVYWNDPRCKLDNLNGNCYTTGFTFYV